MHSGINLDSKLQDTVNHQDHFVNILVKGKPFNILQCSNYSNYRNIPKFSDRQVWANSADPDQAAPGLQSDQGLHCLQSPLHVLESLVYGRATLFNFLGVPIFRKFMVNKNK